MTRFRKLGLIEYNGRMCIRTFSPIGSLHHRSPIESPTERRVMLASLPASETTVTLAVSV